VPRLDAVLYTHADGDHFGKRTARTLERNLAPRFVAPATVLSRLEAEGVAPARLELAEEGGCLQIGEARARVTPAVHDWQERDPWAREDCCGYLIETPDGTVWHPGDTRLLEEHLHVSGVDVLFFDVAVCRSHLGPEGSAKLAETCGAKALVAYHYGTLDVARGGPFGSSPEGCGALVEELPGRFLTPDPGEVLRLP